MVPHERSLVKRMDGKPFALIGVNIDDKREELKNSEKEHNITWRSFWDGADKPIVTKWNVHVYPKIYILDAKGVIRYKDVEGKEIDKAVDALVKEAEAAKKP